MEEKIGGVLKDTVKVIVIGLLIYAALGYLMKRTIDMPVVYVSWTTMECVKVEPKGSCNDMPERYNRIWVQ